MAADLEPLIVILGETASGKTALAIELAKRFDGEIISADSRTVYKEMDIGTAKPSKAERIQVPHHLVDVVSPDEKFTVADFQRLAQQSMKNIYERQHIPFLVGGSGLYIDAVIYDFELLPPPDPAERKRLQKMSVQELQTEIMEKGYQIPANKNNPRHLTRVIETAGKVSQKNPLRSNTLLLGLSLDRDELKKRIAARADRMIEQGLVSEVRYVGEKYGWESSALQAPAYRAFKKHVAGDSSLEEAKNEFMYSDLQLAKRQRTWFRRNSSIQWIDSLEQAESMVDKFLHKSS